MRMGAWAARAAAAVVVGGTVVVTGGVSWAHHTGDRECGD
jgi:hypothetical protein